MIKEIVEKWEENKHKLEEYFTKTKQYEYDSYENILRKIFELVITEIKDSYYHTSFDVEKMTVIDDGDYQGTTIYLIPKDTYQPCASDYLVTDNYYGSCSGCDTLLAISGYSDEFPTKEQVNDYMTIALHLVQKMRWLDEKSLY